MNDKRKTFSYKPGDLFCSNCFLFLVLISSNNSMKFIQINPFVRLQILIDDRSHQFNELVINASNVD